MLMDKKRVAEILDEMGTILEIKGDNPFRTRAFHGAAETIASLTEDLPTLVAAKTLTDLPGIGEKIAQIITDLVEKGESEDYNSLNKSIPSGLLEMTRIPGLGPKRVKLLYDKLGLKSIGELKQAAETHQLAELRGFGDKSEENILKGIERLNRRTGRRLIPEALKDATVILETISKQKEVERVEIAGSLRRRKELIGDIDIIAICPERNRQRVLGVFVKHPLVQQITGQGDTKASVVLQSGMSCDLRLVTKAEYPFALSYFTGSKEHNVILRSMARDRGWSLNEYGFTYLDEKKKPSTDVLPVCKTEEDIYKSLGLGYVPPELRENTGEVDAAKMRKLPDLVSEKDLRGTFHCHTAYSDGTASLAQMSAKAKEMGWAYWGVADHSKSAVYARGMSVERIKEQCKEIDKLNAKQGSIRIFKGIECDILPDGSLDYPDDVLSGFEYVVAAIHSKLNMSKDEATSRIIKALKNRYVTFLGHPTGRILLEREGYPLNIAEVIQAACDYGKGIEIDSHPVRLDLDWRHLKYAKEKGVKIFINPDAHATEGMEDVRYGVGMARKGWLEPDDVVNTWTIRQVEKYFKSARGK